MTDFLLSRVEVDRSDAMSEWLDATIERLRAQGSDDALVEAKKSTPKLPADLWESIIAFVNTCGGDGYPRGQRR